MTHTKKLGILLMILTVSLLVGSISSTLLTTNSAERILYLEPSVKDMSSGFMGQVVVRLNQAGSKPSEEMTSKIEEYQKRNPDVQGWIQVDEYGIDYPVLYSTDNTEYLRANIDHEYDVAGCIYLDANYGNIYSPVKLIHGHNMHDGTMFADFPQMLHWDTLNDAPEITYCDALGVKKFKIFSVFSVDATKESVIIPDCTTLDDLLKLKNSYREKSWIPVDDIPESSEMLMLNTCWYGESGKEHFLHCILVAARVE